MTTIQIENEEKELDIIRRFKIILIDDEDEDNDFPITMERLNQFLDSIKEEKGKIRDYIEKSIGVYGSPKDDEEIREEYGLTLRMFAEFKGKVFERVSTASKISILTGRRFPVDTTHKSF